MHIIKKIFKILYTIVFTIFILTAFFITLTSLDIVKGYNFYVVMSGSMEPNIKTGSIVGVKKQNEYNKGDIITVEVNNNPNNTYTHRIVEVNDDSYITKGDANKSNDADPAFKNSVLGSVFVTVPLIGYVINFAKQPTGFILMVVIPAIIIVALEINSIKESIVSMMEKKKNINSDNRKENEKN